MLYKLIKSTENFTNIPAARAHCDIPCKIYDPAPALIAALSVIRMIDVMSEANEKENSLDKSNSMTRCVLQKEVEAEKIKHEIRVIWGDYFKTPQFESHPQIHDLTHQIMLKASTCKQTTDRENAETLLELVNQFAEIFWKTKGIKTDRKEAPYPPALPVVYPVL